MMQKGLFFLKKLSLNDRLHRVQASAGVCCSFLPRWSPPASLPPRWPSLIDLNLWSAEHYPQRDIDGCVLTVVPFASHTTRNSPAPWHGGAGGELGAVGGFGYRWLQTTSAEFLTAHAGVFCVLVWSRGTAMLSLWSTLHLYGEAEFVTHFQVFHFLPCFASRKLCLFCAQQRSFRAGNTTSKIIQLWSLNIL